MKSTSYLIFTKKGITGTRKTAPPLRQGEYAVKITLVVDDKYFKHAIPEARLEIDERYIIEPPIEIEPEMTAEAIMGGELGPQ